MAVIEASEAGGAASEVGAWVGAKVPGVNDDVVFGLKSGSVTIAASIEWKSLSAVVGYAKTLTQNAGQTLKIKGKNAGGYALEWLGGTYSAANGVELKLTSGEAVKVAAKSMAVASLIIELKTKVTLTEAFTSKAHTLTEGSWITAGFEWVSESFSSSNNNVRELNIEGSIVKLSGVATIWTTSVGTNMTLVTTSSTIEVTNTGVTARSFIPSSAGTQKFATLILVGSANTPVHKIGGSCTIEFLKFTDEQKCKVEVTSGRTLTITKLRAKGASGKVITIEASAPGTAFTITAGGTETISCDWLSIKDCHAPATKWFAGANSTNTSGNEGWKFTVAAWVGEFSVGQAQSAALTHQNTSARTLTATQGQEATKTRVLARVMTLTQGQSAVATKSAATSRTLSVTQAQGVSFRKALGRTLSLTQGQTATMIHGAATVRTLTTTQGSSATRVVRPERVLTVVSTTSYTPQDTLTREEAPLSNAGKWKLLFADNATAMGDATATGWTPKTLEAPGHDAAYWNQVYPGTERVAVEIGAYPVKVERDFTVWTCVTGPASFATGTGYRLRWFCLGVSGEASVTLERLEGGGLTVLGAEVNVKPANGDLIGIRVSGGKVYLEYKKGAGAWEVLKEAADAHFTEGLAGIGGRSNPGGLYLKNFRVGEGVAVISGGQGQAVTRLTRPERTLSATQAQAAAVRVTAIARTLTSGQGQSASITRSLARTLNTIQVATSALGKLLARTLSSEQGQSASLVRAPSRTLTATQTGSVSLGRSVARTLSVGQTQEAVVVRGHASLRTLTATQGQVVVRTTNVGRILSSPQGQAVSKSVTVARTLATSQAQSATRAGSPARTLSATQGQAAVQSHSVPLLRTLSATQGQAATKRAVVARALSATQGQAASIARSPSRHFAVVQSQAVALSRTPTRTLSVAQATSVVFVRRLGKPIPTTQGQAASLTKALGRSLSVAQGQTATLDGKLVVNLLPPLKSRLSIATATLTPTTADAQLANGTRATATAGAASAAATIVPEVEPAHRIEKSVFP